MDSSKSELLKKEAQLKALQEQYLKAKDDLESYKQNNKDMPKEYPYAIYSESTPNPLVMKFVANKILSDYTKECKSINDTGANTLLRKLFSFPFIQEVFISQNYISVKKHTSIEWGDVTNQLRMFIQEELNNKTKILAPNIKKLKTTNKNSKLLEQINTTIETEIRPSIQMDGGDIEIISLEHKVLKVFLKGACSGCPSSQITLKEGIQKLLQEKYPDQISEVIALNN